MHRNSMLKAGTRSEQRLIAPGCKTFSTNPADLIFYCPQRSMGKRSPSRCHVEFECNTASARRSLRRVKARWATLRKHLTAQFFLKRRVRKRSEEHTSELQSR